MHTIDKEQFVSSARSFIGVPWAHGGRSKENGIDCTGLIVTSANLSGGNVEDKLDYSRQDEFVRLIREVNDYCDKVSEDWREVEIGDILIFRSRLIHNHVGIYSGDGKFIHAMSHGAMCVTEEVFNGFWRMSLKSIYRFKDMEGTN